MCSSIANSLDGNKTQIEFQVVAFLDSILKIEVQGSKIYKIAAYHTSESCTIYSPISLIFVTSGCY